MIETLVIGGGASGLIAAITAARCGEQVTILERNRKPLKKLAITGNGRGNLLNSGELRYYGDSEFAINVMSNCSFDTVYSFLESLGISLTEESEGRIYPSAYLASVAVEAMLFQAKKLGITIINDTYVTKITSDATNFLIDAETSIYPPTKLKSNGKVKNTAPIETKQNHYYAKRIIVAVGGMATPVHGTDGSSYRLLENFHHNLTPLRPALSALICNEILFSKLTGQRMRACLYLTNQNQQIIHKTTGEILFTDYGISGIAAMQLARFYMPNLTLHIDFTVALMGEVATPTELDKWLTARLAHCENIEDCFIGCCTKTFAQALCAKAKSSEQSLLHCITDWTIPLIDVRGFEQSQVTAGGLVTEQFSSLTLESTLVPNLYAVGEVLNVDGDCGGYNLMFAFSSGMLAGSKGMLCPD